MLTFNYLSDVDVETFVDNIYLIHPAKRPRTGLAKKWY